MGYYELDMPAYKHIFSVTTWTVKILIEKWFLQVLIHSVSSLAISHIPMTRHFAKIFDEEMKSKKKLVYVLTKAQYTHLQPEFDLCLLIPFPLINITPLQNYIEKYI